jgi:DNA-binding response OmpR family regulator
MKILLVEDDKALSESLAQYLEREFFDVLKVNSFSEACHVVFESFDLAILDWNLGDGQGIDLLKIWRAKNLKKPVLFLSAKTDLTDKVLSLESGAVDYITKPFEPRELLARIRVHLRSQPPSNEIFSVGPIQISPSSREVRYKGQFVDLSKTEFDLLRFLAQHPNQVFSREELLKEVWDYNNAPTTRTVDTHILQLRQKLTADCFETVHGIGYRLKATI